MPSKEFLLQKMVQEPRNFNEADFLELVMKENEEAVTFNDLRNNIRHIYDMNESSLLTESDAMNGFMGKLNRWKQKNRRNKFFSRMRKGARAKGFKNIVAEGDSWFCFPFYVKDINAWLIDEENINLYSMAAAGDWITNIIYEGKYVEQLSLIEPEIFLISGGGNDFVGSYRLSFMINMKVDEKLSGDDFIKACISDAFYAFIWTLKTQYWILLTSLKKAKKLAGMKIITQGYDYVIPSPKKWRCFNLIQWAINQFGTATGDWLHTALKLKGLHDENIQQQIMRRFIDKVNEMFESLATQPNIDDASDEKFQFPNLYHVDCRGVAGGFDGWFDEIHLKSHKFETVANAYKHLIFETTQPVAFDAGTKVIKATWFN